MRKKSRGWMALTAALLILFAGTFAAALFAKFRDDNDSAAFALACLSAASFLSAFLPVFVMILHEGCTDCKRRGVKPTFIGLFSFAASGLANYILRRDYLADIAQDNK